VGIRPYHRRQYHGTDGTKGGTQRGMMGHVRGEDEGENDAGPPPTPNIPERNPENIQMINAGRRRSMRDIMSTSSFSVHFCTFGLDGSSCSCIFFSYYRTRSNKSTAAFRYRTTELGGNAPRMVGLWVTEYYAIGFGRRAH